MERHNGIEPDPEGAFVYYADAQATVEALQVQLRLSRFNQANAEAEYNGLQAQIRTLTQQLDSRRAKAKDIQKTLAGELQVARALRVRDLEECASLTRLLAAERGKVKGQSQRAEYAEGEVRELLLKQDALELKLSQLQALVRAKEDAYEKILLSRERLEREMRGYPPVDNEGIPMVWQEPVGWVKRHPGRYDAR